MATYRFNKPGENLNYALFVSNVRYKKKIDWWSSIPSASAETQIYFCHVTVNQEIVKE